MFPSLRVAEKRSKTETAAAELALRFRRRAQTVLAESPVSVFSLGSNVARKTFCPVCLVASFRPVPDHSVILSESPLLGWDESKDLVFNFTSSHAP